MTVESRVRSPATTRFLHWWWLVVGVSLGFGVFVVMPAGTESAPATRGT